MPDPARPTPTDTFLPDPPVVPPSPRPPVRPPDPGCSTLPVTPPPALESLLQKLGRPGPR